MDISRSGDWAAQALVFSGRPDPVWAVDHGTAVELVSLWEGLNSRQSPAAPPPLGYRGVVLRAPDGRVWSAYGGTIIFQPANGMPNDREVRDDPGQEFERRLLATAPPDAVPNVGLEGR